MKTVKVVAVYLAITERTFHVKVPESSEGAMIAAAEFIVKKCPRRARLVKTLNGEPVLEETYSTILP